MKKKIKVMHCLETIGSGGVEQRRLSLSRYLSPDEFEQMVVCSKVKGGFDERLSAYGTVVHPIGTLYPLNIKYFRRLFKLIKEFKPDIIHGAVFEGVISAVIGGIVGRVPVIIIEETSEPANRSWRGNLLFGVLAIFARRVIATSPAVYKYITETARVSPRKATLIMNGVDFQEAPAEEDVRRVADELKITPDHFVIGSVGRMIDDHKNFAVLINAFATLVKEFPDICLLLVGEGPDKMKLEQLVDSLHIGKHVRFAGYQTDTRPYYSIMHIFALVSAREGFGIVVVEAMNAGLPVVGTAVGGIKDIVVQDQTGLLVPVGDVKEVANAIRKLYVNSSLCKSFGAAGKLRAQQHFTASRYAGDVGLLYKELAQYPEK